MKKYLLIVIALTLLMTNHTIAANCTAQILSQLTKTDLSLLNHRKLDVNFGRSTAGADISGYYNGEILIAIIATFKGSGGRANMNFYFLDPANDAQNYLMEYHALQNSNFYGENDSVILTDEKSYYHVCDNKLLSPAFGGIIDDDIYDNMKLVLDVILTEISTP